VSHLLHALLVVLGGIGVLMVVALFGIRIGREVLGRRRAQRRREVRELLLTALMGEPDEAAGARAVLRNRAGSQWAAVEDQAFAMIPKIKGDSRDALVTLLLSRGAAARAAEQARSRSQVRRARAAYRLGALSQRDTLTVLLGLVRDSSFLVRRMAVLAVGQVGDALGAPPLVDAATADPRLGRDVLAALARIGEAAAPALRRELRRGLEAATDDRRATLAAMALGLLGDVAAVPLLTEALEDPRPGLAPAAAEALGAIGSPAAVHRLLLAADRGGPELRTAAARAIGAIGDESAAGPLAATLPGSGHQASRAIAGALLRMGRAGLDALGSTESPYAAEALAVHSLRQRA
jgi:HEAT repeat protein